MEKETLERYRKEKIVLGVGKFSLRENVFQNVPLHSIINNMLREYLDLNIEVYHGNWNDIYNKHLDNKVNMLLLTPTQERRQYSIFSEPFLNQNLYLGNLDRKFSVEDIEGEDIYIFKNSIYEDFFKKFLVEQNIDANFLNIDKYKEGKTPYIVGLDEELLDVKNKMFLGSLPGASLAMGKEYSDLLPIINNAIEEKYLDLINKKYESVRDNSYKEIFNNYLTEDEKEYLKNKDNLSILIKDKDMGKGNTIVSLYRERLKVIERRTGINIRIVNSDLPWRKIYKKFSQGDIDTIPVYRTELSAKYFNLSKAINTVTLYKINSYESTSKKIGAIRNTLGEALVHKYYLEDRVKLYSQESELKSALSRGEVKSAFVISYLDLNMSKFQVEMSEEVPVYLAVAKDDPILLSILNKVIDSIKDKDSLVKKYDLLNQYNNYLNTKNKENSERIHSIFMYGLIILFTGLVVKLVYQVKLSKRLKKDFLTGLPSRIVFNEFKKSGDKKVGYTILIDVNNFKELNDKYGHATGDEVIVSIGDMLKKVFAKKTTFRISGDEFYIFLEDDKILPYLQKLNREILKYNIRSVHYLSISLGYYYRKDIKIPLDEAFKYADFAMYKAKREKKSFCVEATEELILKCNREVEIRTLLRESNLNDMYANFQPKFDIKTGKVVGAEALARWETAEMGVITPKEFIAIAEDINRIELIDFKIAEEAIKTVKSLREKNLVEDDFKMSFNISMDTFEKESVVNRIGRLLKIYDVPGHWLEIEVTESILSTNLNKTLKKLDDIRKLDIQISIDDFTAGHSTASLLTHLSVDVVKFDKSILDIICEDKIEKHSVYKNLITLVKDLKLKVVAEGIETPYQLDFLKENVADIGQGFLYSKPITKDELESFIIKCNEEYENRVNNKKGI